MITLLKPQITKLGVSSLVKICYVLFLINLKFMVS
jgi:hypothetical protein